MKSDTKIRQLLLDCAFDQFQDAPIDNTIFRMHFKKIGSLGDYILITGRKSTGKTKVISAGIAAALSGQEIFKISIKLPEDKKRVVHFDTEQGRGSHYKMMKLIKEMGNFTQLPPWFTSFRCRRVGPSDILKMIEHFITHYPDTGIIFLDGMLDTIDSMNDEVQANKMKLRLQQISEEYNLLFIGVIHRGFSADKAIGHIGSYLERGAQTVLKIDRDKKEGIDFYSISTEYIRDDSPPPDTAFYFNVRVNQWEIFELAAEFPDQEVINTKMLKNSPLQYDISEHIRRVGQIFNSIQDLISYSDLINEICIAYGCNRSIARNEIYQLLLSQGMIFKIDNGYTNKKVVKLFAEK